MGNTLLMACEVIGGQVCDGMRATECRYGKSLCCWRLARGRRCRSCADGSEFRGKRAISGERMITEGIADLGGDAGPIRSLASRHNNNERPHEALDLGVPV